MPIKFVSANKQILFMDLAIDKKKGCYNMFEKFLELKPEVLSMLGVLILLAAVIAYMGTKKGTVKMNTRMIVYGSLSIALSFVLSYIRLYRLPQGGSITPASMLPMFLFSVTFGPIPGMIAGVAYGFLQFIQDFYFVHWAQLFIDYPLAFGALGLAGLYRKNMIVACFIGGFGRFLMHFLSGVIFFASFAGDANVWLYSLIYNGSTIGVDVLICIVVAMLPQVQSTIKTIQKDMSV